jgi:hypothetical protein
MTAPVQQDINAQYEAAGFTPEQIAQFTAIQNAQSPAELAQAANAAGLTGPAQAAAAGQMMAGVAPGPIAAPSFEDQLAEYQQRNVALQAQLDQLNSAFRSQLSGVQDQLAQLQGSMPTKVDPVTESATKVARAFTDVAASDAKNILRSALHSHLIGLGLENIAKALSL